MLNSDRFEFFTLFSLTVTHIITGRDHLFLTGDLVEKICIQLDMTENKFKGFSRPTRCMTCPTEQLKT